MKIEQRKLSDIRPYPGNPHQNDAAVDAVALSPADRAILTKGIEE